MASSTTNLDLILPVGGENVSRQIINANNVKIDEAVGPVPSGTDLQSQVTALNNNISTLGGIINGSNNNTFVSVSNDTAVVINSITLTAGKWIVIAAADWHGNGTGYRQIAFNANSLNPGRNYASTTQGIEGSKEAYQQITVLVDINTNTTYTVYGRQTSGSSLNVYPYVYAMRVGL